MSAFSTIGYTGENSPNRADAAVWALTELFPGVVKQPREKAKNVDRMPAEVGGWMGA